MYEKFEQMKPDAAPRAESDEKRPTVTVTNGAGRGLVLQLHQVVPDDGAGRAFLGRMPDGVQLQAGISTGIDKQFMDLWLEQNAHFAKQMGITATDEQSDEPHDLELGTEREQAAADEQERKDHEQKDTA